MAEYVRHRTIYRYPRHEREKVLYFFRTYCRKVVFYHQFRQVMIAVMEHKYYNVRRFIKDIADENKLPYTHRLVRRTGHTRGDDSLCYRERI